MLTIPKSIIIIIIIINYEPKPLWTFGTNGVPTFRIKVKIQETLFENLERFSRNTKVSSIGRQKLLETGNF